MARRKGKSKHKGLPRKHKSVSERLIEQKSKKFVQAVKEYWAEQERLHREFNVASAGFDARPGLCRAYFHDATEAACSADGGGPTFAFESIHVGSRDWLSGSHGAALG